MKAQREHSIPLCDEAIEILKTMQQWRMDGAERVFQGARGGIISDVAINKILHSVVPDVTVHGFRSSFRVWGAEITATPSAVLELALAHVNQNRVEAAYQRSDLFERRRELMHAWGAYCGSVGNLVQLHREKVA
jgi:integrase